MRRSLGSAAALALSVGLLAAGCDGRERRGSADPPAVGGGFGAPALIELDLTRGAPETAPSSLFGKTNRRTHVELVRAIRAFADEDSTKGVFVRLGGASVGFSRAHEIGRMLGEIRAKGRPVVCHADDYDNGSMLLSALGCSKLWVSPAGGVATVGVAAQLLFASRFLGKLNVEADFIQVGKYKGASEPFTRDAPSPEARESLEGTLRGIRSAWISGVAQGLGNESIGDLLEDGPYSAEEAKAKGLVHAVGYLEEARDDAKKLADVPYVVTRFGSSDRAPPVSGSILDVFRSISGASAASTPHVAVIQAVGAISMGTGEGLPFGGSDGIGERELGRTLTRVMNDASAKAVVLRIDSPGGSALASDLLWKRLMKLRAKKPLVVSVGSMAASGGYYMACAADKVVVEPTSIVGSIGVVGGKLALGRALEELGVHAETVAASPDPKKAARATYMSALSAWDEPTRARILAQMKSIYDLFVKRIAEGRAMPVEKVEASAEGRIFAGVEAKDRGLVDAIGGFEDALKLALDLAKLPADTPVDLIEDSPTLFDLFGVEPGVEPQDEEDALDGASRAAMARRAAVAELMPDLPGIGPELRVFLGTMAPLLEGERTLAAMPFALTVR
ncbi:MAG TPA: signal peptide peptidase SppA [Polyangiaceae bacterium]|nr:signal peptide peptidase SppA [Polyangiaceae bacterium]